MQHDRDSSARQSFGRSLEDLLGPSDNHILHSAMPLSLGGDADVLIFRHYVDGVAYVTADLLGAAGDEQVPSRIGNYGLMICTKAESEWAAGLIARLARYSFDAQINPGETMDLGPFANADIKAVLFAQPLVDSDEFISAGRICHLMLCIGITETELRRCRSDGSDTVLAELNEAGIFPFTDWNRRSLH